jgi:lambda family phage portal protein
MKKFSLNDVGTKIKGLFAGRELTAQTALPVVVSSSSIRDATTVVDATPKRRKRGAVAMRRFSGAEVNRLNQDFKSSNYSPDSEIRFSLRTMRGRSRNLCQNEPYARGFVNTAIRNIIGPDGVRFKSNVRDDIGTPDKQANGKINLGFDRWGKMRNASVTKRQSWIDLQRIICGSTVRDGEIFIRILRGFDNEFGFALQILEPDHIDETLTYAVGYNLPNGNKIVMGVEINEWREPVAYWIRKDHPGDYMVSSSLNYGRYTRVAAEDMIHVYVQERPEQTRGIPWMYVALNRLNNLGAYEDAEVIAARINASKMGFFKSKNPDAQFDYDDDDQVNGLITESAPGHFDLLPDGLDFQPYDPTHPNVNLPAFTKAMLRGICSGLGCAYNVLAQDLEGVNFSSIRSGTLDERDGWKMLQTFFIQHCHERVFGAWLEMAILSAQVTLPMSKFDKFNSPKFRGRRWEWVDPQKDAQADAIQVGMGWKTNAEVIEDRGGDPEEVWAELALEQKLFAKNGLTQLFPTVIAAANGDNNQDDPEADKGKNTKPGGK